MTPTLAGFMRESQGGDIIMAALTDSGEGVVIVTSPANPFVPMGMQPGETRSYTQQVSVNYLDDPSDQRYSGSVNGTYTYIGTYQVPYRPGHFQQSCSEWTARAKWVQPIPITPGTTSLRPASVWSR